MDAGAEGGLHEFKRLFENSFGDKGDIDGSEPLPPVQIERCSVGQDLNAGNGEADLVADPRVGDLIDW